MDTFGSLPIPETDYQNNLKEANRHIIDLWLEAFTICYSKEKAVLKFNNELFTDFNMWKQANNMTYEISNIKFGCKLSNLNIPGIVRDGKEKRRFDIDLLKAHYKLMNNQTTKLYNFIINLKVNKVLLIKMMKMKKNDWIFYDFINKSLPYILFDYRCDRVH
jgi:hypothetical protein